MQKTHSAFDWLSVNHDDTVRKVQNNSSNRQFLLLMACNSTPGSLYSTLLPSKSSKIVDKNNKGQFRWGTFLYHKNKKWLSSLAIVDADF